MDSADRSCRKTVSYIKLGKFLPDFVFANKKQKLENHLSLNLFRYLILKTVSIFICFVTFCYDFNLPSSKDFDKKVWEFDSF